MKPRIYRRHGIWVCRSVYAGVMRMGHGYTPFGAWLDWTLESMAAELQSREAAAHSSAAQLEQA